MYRMSLSPEHVQFSVDFFKISNKSKKKGDCYKIICAIIVFVRPTFNVSARGLGKWNLSR